MQKMKIMASGPITSWQIDGEKVETMTDFLFLGTKITADSDCSHEIKRHLLLGRKPMTNPGNVLKSRDITLPTKAHIVKVWMWELDQKEGWSQRTDAFKLWCWRKLLKVPWTWRRSNQSILKEINTEYSLEGLMLKLKLQSFGHLIHMKSQLIVKDSDVEKDWRQKEKGAALALGSYMVETHNAPGSPHPSYMSSESMRLHAVKSLQLVEHI